MSAQGGGEQKRKMGTEMEREFLGITNRFHVSPTQFFILEMVDRNLVG